MLVYTLVTMLLSQLLLLINDGSAHFVVVNAGLDFGVCYFSVGDVSAANVDTDYSFSAIDVITFLVIWLV